MRQIAFYGKGGIGKSTIACHFSYSAAEKGLRVLQVGCSPKNDSTNQLLTDFPPTILDVLRTKEYDYDEVEMDEIITESPMKFESGGKIFCAESGGPEPGIGCGGKGVVEAIETLSHLKVFDELKVDVVIYDILGDVVCGGFYMPIINGYAKETYVVTSGELESLYQVTNVSKAIRRFDKRSGSKLGGLIVNLRRMKNELDIVNNFADLVGTKIIGIVPYSQTVKECGGEGQSVFEGAPDCEEIAIYRKIAEDILNNKNLVIPNTIGFKELYDWWLPYIN
jgi:nitrogenase iron protein NifH